MRAQFVRGQDPKDTLNIGNIKLRADSKLKFFLKSEMDKIVNYQGGTYKIRRYKDSSWESDQSLSMYSAFYLIDGQEFLIKAYIFFPELKRGTDIKWRILSRSGSDDDREYPGSRWFSIGAGFDDLDYSEFKNPSDYFI